MKLYKVEANTPEWFAYRKKNITGSSLKSIVSKVAVTKKRLVEIHESHGLEFADTFTIDELKALLSEEDRIAIIRSAPKKKGFYQLIADYLSIPSQFDEDDRDRGQRLESPALDKFAEVTGKTIVKSPGICVKDDNENISVSPDALVPEGEIFIEGVEAKCLDDANTIEAYLTQKVPSDYWEQIIQYFIVGDTLQRVHLVVYSETLSAMNFAIITVEREDVQDDIDYYTEYQEEVIKEVKKIVQEHAF